MSEDLGFDRETGRQFSVEEVAEGFLQEFGDDYKAKGGNYLGGVESNVRDWAEVLGVDEERLMAELELRLEGPSFMQQSFRKFTLKVEVYQPQEEEDFKIGHFPAGLKPWFPAAVKNDFYEKECWAVMGYSGLHDIIDTFGTEEEAVNYLKFEAMKHLESPYSPSNTVILEETNQRGKSIKVEVIQ